MAVTRSGERRRETARLGLVALLTLLYWRKLVPFALLVLTLAIGLYPLARTGLLELWRERAVGTELFVTVATIVAFIGGEYVAAAVLLTIILIAEFIADLNTDRARASIKALIGATPRTATARTREGERQIGVVHGLGIIAALLGWIGPIQAALLHLGPDVLVFLNSVKLLRVRLDEA